jgi:hypothetical protein
MLVTPRWIGWTLLALLAVLLCGGMAYWQLLRAESATGSLLNAGYALQWPLFGVFFGALWWRMLRQEARALDDVHAGRTPDDGRGPGAFTPLPVPAAVAPADDGPSPFGPRPRGVVPGDDGAVPPPGSARAEWNAMYAEYAEHDAATPDRRAFVEHTGGTGPTGHAGHTDRTETGSQS